MSGTNARIEDLLDRAAQGEDRAVDELLAAHRSRLRQMVAVRMDPQVSARVDPSDVVQEALTEAARKLPEYLQNRPLPFYPWLRQIGWEHLVRLQARHIRARKRTVQREIDLENRLPDESVLALAERLIARGSSPSERLLRQELQKRVRSALDRLPRRDREVLVLWYLEQLSSDEIAAVLEISQAGVKSRHRRALQRLVQLLEIEETGL